LLPKLLSREFYERSPEIVAERLLGKRLGRKLGETLLEGIIVETEAYFGLNDPASRAYHGRKNYNSAMWEQPGIAFIYNVHNNWMFNVVAHRSNQIGAVLIRALEPTKGVAVMKRNRPVRNTFDLTNGPGKLTKSLGIDKKLNGISIVSRKSEIFITDTNAKFETSSSHRIGVRKDLEKKLRFFIKGNKYVSR
jgi:DNA-3-methyladenine glycosylase